MPAPARGSLAKVGCPHHDGSGSHKVRQAEELLRCGVRQGDDGLVLRRADGETIQPRSLTHEFARLIKKTGLRRIRFHDLRHTHLTHCLMAGMHPKIASERAGHSNVSITLDVYSHILPGMQKDAVAKLDTFLRTSKVR